MWRTPLPSRASYNGMIAPPGYPNTRSTPSARKHCKTISAPLSIHRNFLGFGLAFALGSLNRLFTFAARQPAHHPAQLRANNLDGMLLLPLTQLGKVVTALRIFSNPFARKRPILNVSESLLHRDPRS